MKHIAFFTLILLVGTPWRAQAAAVETDLAYLPIEKAIDLWAIQPEVNINLPHFLFLDAVSELNGGTKDPLVSAGIDLTDLKDVKLIHSVIIEANKINRVELGAGVAALGRILDEK